MVLRESSELQVELLRHLLAVLVLGLASAIAHQKLFELPRSRWYPVTSRTR